MICATTLKEAIHYFYNNLRQEDPGCTCFKCAPCSRCTEATDPHGNNIYQKFDDYDIIRYTDDYTYSMEFGYTYNKGYFHIVTRELPSGTPIAISAFPNSRPKRNPVVDPDMIWFDNISDAVVGGSQMVKRSVSLTKFGQFLPELNGHFSQFHADHIDQFVYDFKTTPTQSDPDGPPAGYFDSTIQAKIEYLLEQDTKDQARGLQLSQAISSLHHSPPHLAHLASRDLTPIEE